jgi:hypothetical protein
MISPAVTSKSPAAMHTLAEELRRRGGGTRFIAAADAIASEFLVSGRLSEAGETLADSMLYALEQDTRLEDVKPREWVLLAASAATLAAARPERVELCDVVASIWMDGGASPNVCHGWSDSLVAWALLGILFREPSGAEGALDGLRGMNRHELARTLEYCKDRMHAGDTPDADLLFSFPPQPMLRLLAVRLLAEHDGFGPEGLAAWLEAHGLK